MYVNQKETKSRLVRQWAAELGIKLEGRPNLPPIPLKRKELHRLEELLMGDELVVCRRRNGGKVQMHTITAHRALVRGAAHARSMKNENGKE